MPSSIRDGGLISSSPFLLPSSSLFSQLSRRLVLTCCVTLACCLAQLPAGAGAIALDSLHQQNQQQHARDLGHFSERKRSKDDEYIRFGKRDSETLLPQGQYKSLSLFEPAVKRAPEDSYIRFGKRSGLTPCTLQFLRALPSKHSRLQHVKDCSINRQTRDARSEEEGYIRFGKRSSLPTAPSSSPSSSPLLSSSKREATTVLLGSGEMKLYYDATSGKCFFIFDENSENTIVRDCSGVSVEEGGASNPNMLLTFPQL